MVLVVVVIGKGCLVIKLVMFNNWLKMIISIIIVYKVNGVESELISKVLNIKLVCWVYFFR